MDKIQELFLDTKSNDREKRDKAIMQIALYYEEMVATSGWQLLTYYINSVIEEAKAELLRVDPTQSTAIASSQTKAREAHKIYYHVIDIISSAKKRRK